MRWRLKVTYFSYTITLIIFLSLITLFVTVASPVIDGRLVATSFMYCFLSLTVLLTLALLANAESINTNTNKILFVVFSLAYSVGYVWASFSYFFTNQIIRGQSVLFLYKIFPKSTLFATLFVTALVITSIVFVLNRRIHLLKTKQRKKGRLKVVLVVSAFFLVGFIFIVPFAFNIFNPIVEMYVHGGTVYIVPEEVEGAKLLDVKTSLEKPNVIFILLESVSDERVGAHGYGRNVTPNIDFLASQGIVFDNAYATATHSDYAQPAYLSSRYMLSNTYRNFFNQDYGRKFVWEVFKENGYETAYFSSQDDLWAGMNDYFNFEALDVYSYSRTDGEIDYGTGLGKKDYDHKTMDKILSWMETLDGEKPFFLYTNLQATHTPMSYPKEYATYKPDKAISVGTFALTSIETTENRYDNSLKYVDLQVGRLIDSLREKNLLDNTVIILASDHGHDFYGRHNVEGHGLSIYDEELRVPLIFYFPDFAPERIQTTVSHIDVLPTVVDLLGFEISEDFMGKPMEENRRFFFYTQNHRHLIGMMKNHIKLIIDLNKKTAEIYDLEADPLEENNLEGEKEYDEYILELLLWNSCQKNYFSETDKDPELEKYCERF